MPNFTCGFCRKRGDKENGAKCICFFYKTFLVKFTFGLCRGMAQGLNHRVNRSNISKHKLRKTICCFASIGLFSSNLSLKSSSSLYSVEHKLEICHKDSSRVLAVIFFTPTKENLPSMDYYNSQKIGISTCSGELLREYSAIQA